MEGRAPDWTVIMIDKRAPANASASQACLRIQQRLCLPLTLLLLLFSSASAAETPKGVLIFSSEEQQGPGVLVVNQSIRSTLKSRLPIPAQFFYEAQDSFRISTEKYEDELVRLLQRKYDGERFDLCLHAPDAGKPNVRPQPNTSTLKKS
jgi:hypothetical protein